MNNTIEESRLVQQSVFGRKIDLLLLAEIDDEKGKPFEIELSSMEVKPVGVSSNVETVQFNKNIRVNKSILHCTRTHVGGSGEDMQVLRIDVIGLNASVYALFWYEDVVATVPVIGELLLPSDELEFEGFLESEITCRLLQFVEFQAKLVSNIQRESKRYSRTRYSSWYSDLGRMSPPRSPKETFYTPKRPNN
ncbi:hypothetical protein RMATCC62417_17390 [Rhizopus microsporus]|nr:hypothetical protein RMATCC62417_17390 [Rhizopus microsporus]